MNGFVYIYQLNTGVYVAQEYIYIWFLGIR
jgi:hypothetical protein